VRWFFTKGLLSKSPVFKEWLRTNKSQVWLDVARRLRDDFDPELLLRLQRQNLEYSLSGGIYNEQLWVFFSINMASEESCRAHLSRFETIVPILAKALMQACPRPLLTERERTILERRAMGELIKQIAPALEISERTVRMHLQRIKKKLYTHDLVNAVVIAVRSGMLAPVWKEWRWRSRQRQIPS
jgi:DNA-binding CsgD family transcriptional regulator